MPRTFYALRYTGPGSNAYRGQLMWLWSPTGQLPGLSVADSTGDPQLQLIPATWYGDSPGVNEYVVLLQLNEDALVGESYSRNWGDLEFQVNTVEDPNPDNPTTIPVRERTIGHPNRD